MSTSRPTRPLPNPTWPDIRASVDPDDQTIRLQGAGLFGDTVKCTSRQVALVLASLINRRMPSQ